MSRSTISMYELFAIIPDAETARHTEGMRMSAYESGSKLAAKMKDASVIDPYRIARSAGKAHSMDVAPLAAKLAAYKQFVAGFAATWEAQERS